MIFVCYLLEHAGPVGGLEAEGCRRKPDLCKLPVHFFPSKMSIISTPQGLEAIKDLCIIKETQKVLGIQLQKLHFGEFQEIQLFGVQNR